MPYFHVTRVCMLAAIWDIKQFTLPVSAINVIKTFYPHLGTDGVTKRTLKLAVWAFSLNFLHDSTLFVIDIHQNMPISLISTPFARFQIRLTLAVHPNLILEPCLKLYSSYIWAVQNLFPFLWTFPSCKYYYHVLHKSWIVFLTLSTYIECLHKLEIDRTNPIFD